MQAGGLKFSLSQRSSGSRPGSSRLRGDLTVAERLVWSLSCDRDGCIGRPSGEYRSSRLPGGITVAGRPNRWLPTSVLVESLSGYIPRSLLRSYYGA